MGKNQIDGAAAQTMKTLLLSRGRKPAVESTKKDDSGANWTEAAGLHQHSAESVSQSVSRRKRGEQACRVGASSLG